MTLGEISSHLYNKFHTMEKQEVPMEKKYYIPNLQKQWFQH